MKSKKSTILLLLILLIGLSLLLYPTVSNFWNSFHQSMAIASYSEAVAELDEISYEQLWAEAEAYNGSLSNGGSRLQPTPEKHAWYESLLNVTGNGIMGYIEIPSIGVSLPVYHGVEDTVLQIAIGHIEGTSLPTGGPSTHCVVSGHRGLPSAKLFTDLDKLMEGDIFLLRVLDEVLTYEVDQIHIVEPQEVGFLDIEEGKDLCTMVTCTPYGVNSHRLLVRGHRIENQKDASNIRVTADAIQIEPVLVAPAVAAPMLLLLMIGLMVSGRKNTKSKKIPRDRAKKKDKKEDRKESKKNENKKEDKEEMNHNEKEKDKGKE